MQRSASWRSRYRAQWQKEISVRQLDDPGPLAVRWRFTELDIVDRAEHIARPDLLRSLIGRGRPRFNGRTDRIGEMATEFRKLTRRWLVIIGEPGMGKTTLAVLLLRELLEHSEPDDPVPVLLPMSGWEPEAETLHDWLARRLGEDYPALRAPAFGPDAARSLATPAPDFADPGRLGRTTRGDSPQDTALIRLNETLRTGIEERSRVEHPDGTAWNAPLPKRPSGRGGTP